MTDQGHEQNQPHNSDQESNNGSTDSSLELQYPQILLQASFEELLTRSYPSESSTILNMASHSPPEHHLDQSWTAVEDENCTFEDDSQSVTTDTGSLVDLHSVEDAQSIHEHESEGTASERDEGDSFSVSSYSGERIDEMPTPEASHIVTTTLPAGPAKDIMLEHHTQSVHSESNLTSLSVVTKRFSSAEVKKMHLKETQMGSEADSEFYGTVRMNLAESTLDTNDRPVFRLWLLGPNIDSTLREKILTKFGAALVAGDNNLGSDNAASTSRYHVVPSSFGPGSEPTDADLVEINPCLEVEQFGRCKAESKTANTILALLGHSDSRTISRASHWTGHGFIIDNGHHDKPDLAILCINDEHFNKQNNDTLFQMMRFTSRHSIPVILLRTGDDWNYTCTLPLSSYSEACMEICDNTQPRPIILRQSPLTLNTFLKVDSRLLNRHIAHILAIDEQGHNRALTPAYPGRFFEASTDQKSSIFDKSVLKHQPIHNSKVQAATGRSSGAYDLNTRDVVFQIIRAVLVTVLVVFVTGLGKNLYQSALRSETGTLANSSVSGLSNSGLLTTADVPEPTKGVSWHGMADESVPKTKTSSSIETPDRFEVTIAGDTNFLLKIPQAPTTVLGRSNLQVEVRRDSTSVKFEVQQFYDRVFNIRIEPTDAFGVLEVHLSMRRPSLSEVIMVDMGKNRDISSWADTWQEVNKQVRSIWDRFSGTIQKVTASAALKIEHSAHRRRSRKELLGRFKQNSQKFEHDLRRVLQIKHQCHKLRLKWQNVLTSIHGRAEYVLSRGQGRLSQYSFGRQIWQYDIPHYTNQLTKLWICMQNRILAIRVPEMIEGSRQSEKMANAQDRAQEITASIRSKVRALMRRH